MAINQNKYINITSTVAAGEAVSVRELILRIFTTNPLVPTQSFIEFSNASQVGTYFTTSSEEYKRAQVYFNYIAQNGSQPQKISYASYTPTDAAPLIFGIPGNYQLSTFTPITNGAISLTLGGITHILTGIDFSADVSLAAVALTLQNKIQGADVSTQWSAATVTYDTIRKCFNLTGGDATTANVSTALAGSGTELLNLIGWGSLAIFSNGLVAQSITNTLENSASVSNNFGSFLFMPNNLLTIDEYVEAATWNVSQNNLYQLLVPVTLSNSSAWQSALLGLAGTGITILQTNEFHEQDPGMFLAATDYNKRDAAINYMFKQVSGQTPTVTDTTTALSLDAIKVNYYGATQTAGQQVYFYQNGYLQGGSTDATDMNVYANEQWLKSAIFAAIMNLFLGIGRLPANNQGIIQLNCVIQGVIDQALFNGTISTGKILTTLQKAFITGITGDDNAWQQVQNSGFWLNSFITFNNPNYIANYTLIYSKDDQIRKVNGADILI